MGKRTKGGAHIPVGQGIAAQRVSVRSEKFHAGAVIQVCESSSIGLRVAGPQYLFGLIDQVGVGNRRADKAGEQSKTRVEGDSLL